MRKDALLWGSCALIVSVVSWLTLTPARLGAG